MGYEIGTLEQIANRTAHLSRFARDVFDTEL